MKQKFKNRTGSLSFRIFLVYLSCVLLPILLGSLLFFLWQEQILRKENESNQQISINRACENIALIFDNGYDVLNLVSSDDQIQNFLSQSYGSQLDFYRAYSPYVSSVVRQYTVAGRQISMVAIYCDNPTLINTASYRQLNDSVRDMPWYQAYESRGANQCLLAGVDKSISRPIREPSISMVGTAIAAAKKIHYELLVKLDFSSSAIYNILDGEQNYFDFLLVDPQGKIVCSTNRQYEPLNLEQLTAYSTVEAQLAEKSGTVLLEQPIGTRTLYQGWRLVGIGNTNWLESQLTQARHNIFAVALLSTLLSAVVMLLLTRSYTTRMRLLAQHMEMVRQENFAKLETTNHGGEVGQLVDAFNAMCERINTLIHDVYRLELQKKDLEIEQIRTELRYLQSQVNPHFLFNTLNAMLVVSMKNGYSDLIPMLENLSKMMRRLLDWSNESIPVREELEFVEMYLQIEKFRFRDKIQYTIEADPDAAALPIPKMGIQPLVENACKHGLHKCVNGGSVAVSVRLASGLLTVEVRDTGAGISSSRCGEILRSMEDKKAADGNSIGLQNVYRRLKYDHGATLRFWMEPGKESGTVVGYSFAVAPENARENAPKETMILEEHHDEI